MGVIAAVNRYNMLKRRKENIFDQIENIIKAQNELQHEYLQNSSIELAQKILILDEIKKKLQNLYCEFTNEYIIEFNSDVLNYCPNIHLQNECLEKNNKKETQFEIAESRIITELYNNTNNANENDVNIIISPISNNIINYLKTNPDKIFDLCSRDFEIAMTEIYHKLGYDVEITPQTRDGGKDIIIRTPTNLGDFIYYVECKKYASNYPVGVGIVKNMIGTITTDKVNGGIIATTSYFSSESIKFINENKLNYQIQMHDFNKIRSLLDEIEM